MTALRRPSGSVRLAAALALGFLAQGMVNNLFTVGVTGVFAAFLVGSQLIDARPTREAGASPDRGEARSWSSSRRRGSTQDPGIPIGEDGRGV